MSVRPGRILLGLAALGLLLGACGDDDGSGGPAIGAGTDDDEEADVHDDQASNADAGAAETSSDGDDVEPVAAGEIILEFGGERYAGPVNECQLDDDGPILVNSSGSPQIVLNLGRQGDEFGALNAGLTFEDGTGRSVGVSTNQFEAEVDGTSIRVSAEFFSTDGSGTTEVGPGVIAASCP